MKKVVFASLSLIVLAAVGLMVSNFVSSARPATLPQASASHTVPASLPTTLQNAARLATSDNGQRPPTPSADPLLIQMPDAGLNHYPGARRLDDDRTGLQRTDPQRLQRQITYQTADPVSRVQYWYAQRWNISPASDIYITSSDGCAFLNNANPVGRLLYNATVLMCPVPGGTLVVVTDSLEQGQ